MVEGGEEMEVAVLGNAFEETILAGDPDEAIVPEEIQPEEVEPQPVEVAEVPPVQSEVTAETPTDILPTEADVILPAEEIPPVTAEQPEITATVAPAETVTPEEKPEPEEIKPEPKKKPEPLKKPEKEKPQKKPVKKRAGDAGKQVESANKGQADGMENAVSNSNSGKKGKVSEQAGNASLSNYDGKIRAKLSRAKRYPSAARREKAEGTATIRFVVQSNGSLGSVSLIRSSGFQALDDAAVQSAQRAGPFADTPNGQPRTIIIPIEFRFPGRR
ncbi:energy transducer TonB [Rhizobium herbae]|uniref:Protein TonB n=1 Tax=Rhizobium herbae TaxID=508661 RepID=A0ABS4ETG4_9HYPH|nr:energy transducer TonB [Rhizobium herbae]MBP1861234.1 protein TonB [Rhizobium herbae]